MCKSTEALASELSILQAAVAARRAAIAKAAEVMDAAEEAANIPCEYGIHSIDLRIEGWRYPEYHEARRAYEALCQDDGYCWAHSRMLDLERLLGYGFDGQLPLRSTGPEMYVPLLRGGIPEAHALVSEFLVATL